VEEWGRRGGGWGERVKRGEQKYIRLEMRFRKFASSAVEIQKVCVCV